MKHHDTPPPNLASLRARLTNAAAAESLPMGRVQRYVGVAATAEIFGTLSDTSGPRFLAQGGSALELRLGRSRSRTSGDLDGVFRGDFDEFFDAALEALRTGWAGFTGRATLPEEIDIPGMPVRPRRFTVKLEYHGRPFVSVRREVAPDETGLAAEHDPVLLSSEDDPVVLEAALAAGRVPVTNNVVDFERLCTLRSASDQPVPPLIYTSETAFPRNRKFIGRLVEALEYAAGHRLVHTTGGVLWLAPPPP